MERRRLEVSPPVKMKFTEVRKKLKLKTESETVAFLLALFEKNYSGLSVREIEQLLSRSRDISMQQILELEK